MFKGSKVDLSLWANRQKTYNIRAALRLLLLLPVVSLNDLVGATPKEMVEHRDCFQVSQVGSRLDFNLESGFRAEIVIGPFDTRPVSDTQVRSHKKLGKVTTQVVGSQIGISPTPEICNVVFERHTLPMKDFVPASGLTFMAPRCD
jgi:hypothetical protein